MGAGRPHVLAITAELPAATGSGGQVRAYHCLKAMSTVSQLTIVLLYPAVEAATRDLRTWSQVVTQPAKSEGWTKSRRVLLSRILLTPWHKRGHDLMLAGQNICAERSCRQGFSLLHRLYGALLLLLFSLLRRLCTLDPPDLHVRGIAADTLERQVRDGNFANVDWVWIEHSYLYPLAERCAALLPGSRIAVNAHNVETELKRSQAAAQTNLLARSWLNAVSELCRCMETRMLRRAGFILCCSDDDAERLRRFGNRKAAIIVVPNGVDTEWFRREQQVPQTIRMLFTGTAGYLPNDDAVAWLIQEILPRIRSQFPNAELVLSGRHAQHNWGSVAKDTPGVTIISNPSDMRPILDSATIALVPLRQGSGTRFKILEAFSMGLGVVSTTLGAEGLPVKSGTHILLADTADDFAKAAISLLADPARIKVLGDSGRRLVCEQLDWKTIAQRMLAMLETARFFPQCGGRLAAAGTDRLDCCD